MNAKRSQMFSFILLALVFVFFITMRNRVKDDPDTSSSSGNSSSSSSSQSSGTSTSSSKPPLINDWRVSITGAGLDLIVSYDELREQPLETIENIKSFDAATGEAVEYGIEGPSLGALLASLNVDIAKLGSITCFAGEAAHTVIPGAVLREHDVYLGLDSTLMGINHEPMCVVPGVAEGDFRLPLVSRIELSMEALPDLSAPTVTKVTVFNHAGASMSGATADGSLAFPMHELFHKQFGSPEGSLLRFVTQEGLAVYQRTALASDFRVSMEGEYAPRYFHQFEESQIGQLSFLRSQHDAVWFASGRHKLTDVMAELGMQEAARYVFVGEDGYTANMSADDLAVGTVTVQDGIVTLIWNGLPDNTTITGLLSITAE